MGRYIAENEVEIRLLGKVRFTDDENDENRFDRRLLKKLVADAESRVERDLSSRYQSPFQTTEGAAFTALPKTTRDTIQTMCELMAVVFVLNTDYGRGQATDARAYTRSQKTIYSQMLARETDKKEGAEGAFGQWNYPPLEALMTSLVNTTDDGTAGSIIVSSNSNDGDFPRKQITDPSENFNNGEFDL